MRKVFWLSPLSASVARGEETRKKRDRGSFPFRTRRDRRPGRRRNRPSRAQPCPRPGPWPCPCPRPGPWPRPGSRPGPCPARNRRVEAEGSSGRTRVSRSALRDEITLRPLGEPGSGAACWTSTACGRRPLRSAQTTRTVRPAG